MRVFTLPAVFVWVFFVCQRTPTLLPEPGFLLFFFILFLTKTQYCSCDLRNSLQPSVGSAFEDNLFCMLLKLRTQGGEGGRCRKTALAAGASRNKKNVILMFHLFYELGSQTAEETTLFRNNNVSAAYCKLSSGC